MSAAFDLDRYLARIRAFDGARFEVAEAAAVSHRDRAYPILSVRSRTVASVATRTLLVLAGVHGDEPAGLLAVPSILEAWSSERVRLIVITPVNPVGAAKDSGSASDASLFGTANDVDGNALYWKSWRGLTDGWEDNMLDQRTFIAKHTHAFGLFFVALVAVAMLVELFD